MAEPKQVKAIKGGLNIAKRLLADKEQEALAKLDAGMKLSKAENIAAGLYHPIGEGKKLNVPFSRMTSTTVDNPNVIMHQGKIITPEQAVKERMGFFPLIGDRADTGKILTGVNNRKAKYDTPLTGGGKYMQANYDPIMEKSAGWESGAGKVGTLRNRISDIAQSGYQPVGVFSPGSHVQVDFNTMMPHALLGQFEPTDTTKKLIKQFDKEVKSVYPNWAGITSPEAEAQLMDKGNGILRTAFTKTMGKDDYQSGGFPDVPSVRKAISDPELYDTELGTLGQNMALFEPSGALVASPKNPSAYPLSMSAQNLGKLDEPEKYGEFFTTANERRRLMGSDPAGDYRSFELSQPIQYADEEWLNKLMESRRLRDEAIKAGGYKKGGEVNIDAADARLSKAIAERMSGGGMAKGGSVDIKSADARLQAAIDARMGMAEGGEAGFKKIQFMENGGKAGKVGKLASGIANVGKRLLADAPQAEALKLAQERAALPKSQNGLGLPKNNTPQQRAKAMNRDTDAYHGSKQDITGAFQPGYDDNLAFVTKSPEFANKWIGKGKHTQRVGEQAKQEIKSAEDMYRDIKSRNVNYDDELERLKGDEFNAEYDRRSALARAEAQKEFGTRGTPDQIHSTVYPLTVQSNKIFNPETDMDVMAEFFEKNGIPPKLQELYAGGNYMMYETKPVVEYLKSKGYDSMRLRESTGDDYPTIAVFNPESVRSKFAAHDPFRKDAATAIAMGVAAPDLLANEQEKAEGGGAFKKLEFMADGGKLVKGLGKIGKKLMAERDVLPMEQREENLQKFLGNSRIRDRLYHATPKDFTTFKAGGNDPTLSGPAIWLTPDATKQPAAHNIGGGSRGFVEGTNVMPVYAQARSPLMLDDKLSIEWAQEVYADGSREFPELISPKTVEELKKGGYDSIIYADPYGNRGGEQEIIMFEPNKIKSAIGNRGTYDIEDADITKADGGKIVGGLSKIAKKLMADNVPTSKELMKSGQSVSSHTDAINRLGNGERLFAYHEMSGKPIPITSVDDLKNWTPDQLLSLPTTQTEAGFQKFDQGFQKFDPNFQKFDQRFQKLEPDFQKFEANLQKFLEPSKTPMRLYHGTRATEGGKGNEAIRRIKPSKEGALGSGVYMTPKSESASSYALDHMTPDSYAKSMGSDFESSNVLPVYAQIRNPLILGDTGERIDPAAEALMKLGIDKEKAQAMVERLYEEKGNIGKQIQSRAQTQGYDGLMLYHTDGSLGEVVSYNPNAVKSATGNQGTYDIYNPDLSKSDGGKIVKGLSKVAKKLLEEPRIQTIEAPSIIIPSKLSNVKEMAKKREGEYGARRVERASDEIPNLEKMYQEDALRRAFIGGDNARALMTMNPADFEKYAEPLGFKTSIGPKMAEYAKQGDITKDTVPTDEFIKYLQRLQDGFEDIPFLSVNKEESGLPLVPFITGHEGRHRNRALASAGEDANLIQLLPRAELREPFPRRSQEEYIDAIRKEMEMTNNMVSPEEYFHHILKKNVKRDPIKLPDLYAEGGAAFKTLQFKDAQHFDGGGIAFPEMTPMTEGSRREPLLTEKDWENIKRNAPEVYEWAKQNVKDEASQLKSARGVKDFALRTGAQYLGGIPDLINLGLMGVDALADTNLKSEKPYFGSEQYIDAMRKAGMIGEYEFPIAETVAGLLMPAGLIKKGIKKISGAKPAKQEPKKRQGGLSAMAR